MADSKQIFNDALDKVKRQEAQNRASEYYNAAIANYGGRSTSEIIGQAQQAAQRAAVQSQPTQFNVVPKTVNPAGFTPTNIGQLVQYQAISNATNPARIATFQRQQEYATPIISGKTAEEYNMRVANGQPLTRREQHELDRYNQQMQRQQGQQTTEQIWAANSTARESQTAPYISQSRMDRAQLETNTQPSTVTSIPEGWGDTTDKLRYIFGDTTVYDTSPYESAEHQQQVFGYFDYLTEPQKDAISYYTAQGDRESLDRYLEIIEPELMEKRAAQDSEERRQYAQENPILGTVASVGAALASPLAIPEIAANAVRETVTGEVRPANVATPSMTFVRSSSDLQEGAAKGNYDRVLNATGNEGLANIAAKASGLGTSILQNAALIGIAGGASLPIMSAIAGTQDAYKNLRDGESYASALIMGLGSGLIEAATEKYSLDNLLEMKGLSGTTNMDIFKTAAKNTLQQAGIEASEETVSSIANNLFDIVMKGDRSDILSLERELTRSGMSPEQAKREAFLQNFVYDTMESALGGAISGGLMSGGRILTSTISEGINVRDAAIELNYENAGLPKKFQVTPINVDTATRQEVIDYQEKVRNAVIAYNLDYESKINDIDRNAVNEGVRNILNPEAETNNAVPEGTAVNENGLVALTDQERTHLSTGSKNKIISTLNEAVGFIRNALSNRQSSDRAYLGKISDTTAQRVLSATGVNIFGYNAILPSDSVRHMFNEHGDINKEADRGQLNLTPERAAKITEVLSDPDSVSLSDHPDVYGRQTLIFKKMIDGNYITAQAVTDKRHALTTDTMLITKKKASPATADGTITSSDQTSKTSNGLTPSISDNTVPQENGIVNTTETGLPEHIPTFNENTVGAAQANPNSYSALQNRYGTIEPGENPFRDVDVPVSTNGTDRVSQSIRTVMEAEATPDSLIPTLEDAVAQGWFSYDVIGNEKARTQARDTIEYKGYEQAYEDWLVEMSKGQTGKNLVALGFELYNNAANAGDSRRAVEILTNLTNSVRNAAQAVQAMRLLKRMSPEYQLYAAQRSAQNIQDQVNERLRKRGREGIEIKLDEDLVQQYNAAQDQDTRDQILEEIYRNIATQVPATWYDKWNAWRYMAMLANPRTHVRNIVGNAGFIPLRVLKNVIAIGLERVTGSDRTKALLGANSADIGRIQAAWSDFANIQEQAMGEGKLNDPSRQIDKYRPIFDAKILEAVLKGNTTALDMEDVLFNRPTYTTSLAGYLKANGITAGEYTDAVNGDHSKVSQETIDKARAYAIKEAQKATYRDANAFSDFVARVGKNYQGDNKWAKAASVAVESVLPFKRTPANILARGVEYSPIGLIKGLTYDLVQVHKGNMTASQAIDDIASGLSGSVLMALGAFLASQGILNGRNKDEDQDKKNVGIQDFSINIGGKNITLDWLAPEALPLFVGVRMYEEFTDADNKITLDGIMKAMQSIADPVLEMSMLQGVQDIIDSATTYNTGENSLVNMASDLVANYLMQGLPTIFGQLERTFEPNRESTYVDRRSPIPTDVQRAIGKALNKVPSLEYAQMDYIDVWGNKQSNGQWWERALNNFVNPAYVRNVNETDVDKELSRLERSGYNNMVPSTVPYSQKVNGEYLTAEQYQTYATTKGQTAYQVLDTIMSSPDYQSLSDDEKSNVVSNAYSYAAAKAKEAVSDYTPDSWMQQADLAAGAGIDVPSYIIYQQSLKDFAGGTVTQDEIEEYLDGTDYTDSQKAYLWALQGKGWASKNNPYIEGFMIEGYNTK